MLSSPIERRLFYLNTHALTPSFISFPNEDRSHLPLVVGPVDGMVLRRCDLPGLFYVVSWFGGLMRFRYGKASQLMFGDLTAAVTRSSFRPPAPCLILFVNGMTMSDDV